MRAGFPHRDTSWLFGLVIVEAPLDALKAVANTVEVEGESHTMEGGGGKATLLTWQSCEPDLARQLSKGLGKRTAYVWSEDVSGWFGYGVFEKGKEVEAFEVGPTYEDELGEIGGEEAEVSKKEWPI